MARFAYGWVLALAIGSGSISTWADSPSRAEMHSLDEQVQEIKSDVLAISAELAGLEERLLFPSGTQVTVFVALDDASTDESFRLDAVRLDIDDTLAAHHIYSFKEIDALAEGGVQRLFMGNLPTGAHELRVSVAGKLANGDQFTATERFSFDKGVEPTLLGLTLAGRANGAAVRLEDW